MQYSDHKSSTQMRSSFCRAKHFLACFKEVFLFQREMVNALLSLCLLLKMLTSHVVPLIDFFPIRILEQVLFLTALLPDIEETEQSQSFEGNGVCLSVIGELRRSGRNF